MAEKKINNNKRIEREFVAEGLDNIGSVKKIVDFLRTKKCQNKVYKYYCQTIRQRRTTHGLYMKNLHFVVPGHPLTVFSEEWDGGLNSGFFEPLSYKSLNPKIISKLRHAEKSDPLTAQLKEKMDWQRLLIDFRRKIAQAKAHSHKWLNDEVLECPKVYLDVAEHLERDPDRNFECSFNWYYAGNGNMQLISLNGEDYLLHSEFSCMYILPFSKEDPKVDFDNSVVFNCGDSINIYETICSSENIVALRTKNKVFILKIIVKDTIEIQKMKEMDSIMPFTGISFDDYHKNILYVTALDTTLIIVNIDRMTGRTKKLRNKTHLVDNWGTVMGSERGYFTHVSRKAITLYDKRTNEPIDIWKRVRDLTDDISCNYISFGKQCEGTPFLYFGTDHHLFLMDMRRCKSNNNTLRVVQRWTHGMQCPPTYMRICNFMYDKELLCLSSQWCEDMCVLSNYANRMTRQSEIRGISMPFRPPSILNTLNEARQKMLCCDISDPIDYRLCTAVTGLLLLEQGENYNVLMQNSLGDVSSHALYPEYMSAYVEDDSLERLSEWAKCFKPKKDNIFEVTSIENIASIWNKLKKIPETYVFGQVNNKYGMNFNEEEITEAFENEEIDTGLLDAWMKDTNDTKMESELSLFFMDE